MKLYIDTRNREEITISIKDKEKILISKKNNSSVTPESALSLLELALNEIGVDASEIKEIEVERGPGSYTGTRVGVALANALSLSLQVPINGKDLSKLESPKY